MRMGRLSGLMLAVSAAASGPPADADDVFTPLTAVPFTPTTTPVPGTDGNGTSSTSWSSPTPAARRPRSRR